MLHHWFYTYPLNRVDGLSRLPPIRLKSEAEIAHQETPKSASFSQSLPDEDNSEEHAPETDPTGFFHPDATDTDTTSASPMLVASPGDIPVVSLPEPVPLSASPLVLEKALPPDVQSPNSSLKARSESALLTISPPPEQHSTPVSGDILLPLIIFSVVKSNPPHLVSELLYAQRYRNQSVGGEESYCLVNLMAVAEFLENVDLGALGLGDSEKKVFRYALYAT